MRRRRARERSKAGAMASRDRALLVLLAAGFTVPETGEALGLSRSAAYATAGRIGAIRGRAIEPDPDLSAAVSACLDRVGLPRPRRRPDAPPGRSRVEAAIADRPGASPREIAEAAGVSLAYAVKVLTDRAAQ